MRELLLESIRRSVRQSYPDVGEDLLARLTLETPRIASHGDFSATAAFLLKDVVGDSPRKIAERLVADLLTQGLPSDVEIAGPGFINFRIHVRGLHEFLAQIADPAARRGLVRLPDFARERGRMQIEFVSANPTGPMNVVSARAAAFGDACVRLLRAIGVDVQSEYYVNDAGNQAELFGESLRARFLEAAGRDVELPEDAYRGDYVRELAEELLRAIGALAAGGAGPAEIADFFAQRSRGRKTISELRRECGSPPPDFVPAAGVVDAAARSLDFTVLGIDSMVAAARASLSGFGVEFDTWFRESDLHASEGGESRIAVAERVLRERGNLVEREGALWFAATQFGDDKDRVVRRSDGTPTYLLADVAYHLDKAARGFRKVVDVLGPDHHGYIRRLQAALVASGLEESWLKVLLVQQVNLLRGGVAVKMSKREGEFVTMDELVEEVGKDVSRFFFLMRKASSHLDFDLELAKKETLENPVFYVQYAHARSRSIFRQPLAGPLRCPPGEVPDLAVLIAEEEVAMMRQLLLYPERVQEAAISLEPHRLVEYLREVAGAYHRFYTRGKKEAAFRVLVEDERLARARLYLVGALADVLRDGLNLLGIDALEEM
jgi:arginyl-tRNA synthetase